MPDELIKRLMDCQRQAYLVGLQFIGKKDQVGFQIFEKAFSDAAAEIATLRQVLKAMHDEYLDYSLINNLTGHNNHNVRWARLVMGMKEYLTEQEARAALNEEPQ